MLAKDYDKLKKDLHMNDKQMARLLTMTTRRLAGLKRRKTKNLLINELGEIRRIYKTYRSSFTIPKAIGIWFLEMKKAGYWQILLDSKIISFVEENKTIGNVFRNGLLLCSDDDYVIKDNKLIAYAEMGDIFNVTYTETINIL